ncbi:cytochrome P450 1A2 [Armadillidium vulgare]|nr:cytochrome P450 1A2 [Armadillidium vulgare]
MIGRINYDSKYFDSPKEFKPERFLNSEGKIMRRPQMDSFLLELVRKRQCLGESLARMELFVFLATYLQYLEFSCPENYKLDITPDNIPFINKPKPNQKIVASIRNQKE